MTLGELAEWLEARAKGQNQCFARRKETTRRNSMGAKYTAAAAACRELEAIRKDLAFGLAITQNAVDPNVTEATDRALAECAR